MAFFMGIFGGHGVNPSAALFEDGRIVAFAEEERFIRVKGAAGALPMNAMHFCLERADIGFDDVAGVGFAWECPRYCREMRAFLDEVAARYPSEDTRYNEIHEARLISSYEPIRLVTDLRVGFAKRGLRFHPERLRFLPHHECHAASSFLPSGFDEATIVTLDGSGEEFTTCLWHGRGTQLRQLGNWKLPDTLGGYYATFTEYLGFQTDREEGKLMALAAYGAYCEETQRKLERVARYDPETGDFEVNPYFRFLGRRSQGQRFTDRLVELFGPPRLRHQAIEARHQTLAFNVQWRLEQIAAALCRNAIARTGSRNLCLAGGVAMNCKMNGTLARLPEVESLFVQPAAADNGVALGAAYLLALEHGVTRFPKLEHAYWGPSHSDAEIERALREAKLRYRRSEDLAGEVAALLAEGRIVGWFQGAMEVGARALGNRSILANPLDVDCRDRLNREVKHREMWRPFCPSLPAEHYARYFGDAPRSDFMILAFDVLPELRDRIPAAVHVDGTARPQAVYRESNPRFHALLEAFGRRTGHPVLINTSFNVQGEPMVASPADALRCFGGTGIDVLAMGDFIVEKSG